MVRAVSGVLSCKSCGRSGHTSRACVLSREVSVERDRLFWECVDPSQQPANYLTSSPPQLSSSPAAANTPQLVSTPDMFADSLDSL